MPRPLGALAVLSAGLVCTAFACSSTGAGDAPSRDVDAAADTSPGKPKTGPSDDEDAGAVGPTRLSETGLYADFAKRELAPDVVPFAPSHPLWSDGEEKRRFLRVPPGTKIDTTDIDRWVFPVGTKAWKEFWVGGKLVETRLLWRRAEGRGYDDWFTVAYVWEPDGSDAIARPEGVRTASGTNHDVPSQEDCKACHGHLRSVVLGFSAFEVETAPFASKGMFNAPPKEDLVVPGDAAVRDALAYLHGNCGFCHNEDGDLRLQSVMRLRLRSTDRTPEETNAYTTTINAKMRHVMGEDIDRAVVPGQPEKSQVYMRLVATDVVRMPPKGRKLVDPAGSAVIRDWILGLPPQ